jgi:Methyltransferase domain
VAFGTKAPEPRSGGKAGAPATPAGHPCASLARLLARVYKEPKPEILDLGPLYGDSAIYFAGRGARLFVEGFEPPAPKPERRPGEPYEEPPRFRMDHHPSGRFHLVLAWEALDFVPPDRLAEVGQEIQRVTRDGGHLLLFSYQKPPQDLEVPPRYRMLADDLIVREPAPGASPRRRYAHPNREIERALTGMSVQGIHLQRNQMREIVVLKPGVG